jgi:hypothetical protein
MSQESEQGSQESEQGGEESEYGSGVLFRAPDGTVYFIRDEVLNQCRQPEEIAEKLVRYVTEQSEVEGFSIETSQEITAVGKLSGPIGPSAAVAPTQMCSRVLK